MIAALESHSIGVLSGFPTAPEAFERSFCIRKVPSPLGPIFVFYTRCRGALSPDMFLPLLTKACWIPAQHYRCPLALFSFVIHPKPDLSTTLKS
jgi:hypothetical protein